MDDVTKRDGDISSSFFEEQFVLPSSLPALPAGKVFVLVLFIYLCNIQII